MFPRSRCLSRDVKAICPQDIVRRKSDAGWVTLFLCKNKFLYRLSPDPKKLLEEIRGEHIRVGDNGPNSKVRLKMSNYSR